MYHYLDERFANKDKIMGFGHRVYKEIQELNI